MKDNTKKTIKLYLQAIGKYKLMGAVIFIASVLIYTIENLIPFYFKKFFDILVSNSGGVEDTATKLLGILSLIAVLFFSTWVLWRINTFSLNYFESKILSDLANRCFAYLHRHSFSFFNNNFVGSLVKKVNWFVRAFEF